MYFADTINNTPDLLKNTAACILDVSEWMTCNKQSEEKTEVIFIGKETFTKKCHWHESRGNWVGFNRS